MVSGRDFLGPYRLVRLIRSGQTCQVWDSVKDTTREHHALKVLLKDHIGKKDQINFLKHEELVGKPLDHKYVIKIFEFNFSHGLPFLAMELFHAKNLKQELRENKANSAYNAEAIIRRCAKGLLYLHEQGWVHCDVKPDNFLVGLDADIRLIDFALAQKIKKKGGIGSFFGGRSRSISGTRSYISPEQILRKPLDQRADVYSFGCVVYEILTGKPPFAGVSPDDLLQRHLSGAIPNVQANNKSISPKMADLISRMLSKKPEGRPETLQVFLEEFKRIRVYRPGMQPPAPDSQTE